MATTEVWILVGECLPSQDVWSSHLVVIQGRPGPKGLAASDLMAFLSRHPKFWRDSTISTLLRTVEEKG